MSKKEALAIHEQIKELADKLKKGGYMYSDRDSDISLFKTTLVRQALDLPPREVDKKIQEAIIGTLY